MSTVTLRNLSKQSLLDVIRSFPRLSPNASKSVEIYYIEHINALLQKIYEDIEDTDGHQRIFWMSIVKTQSERLIRLPLYLQYLEHSDSLATFSRNFGELYRVMKLFTEG